MSDLQFNAHICEIPDTGEIVGAYYPVNLEHIPRQGELIDLFSFIDSAADHAPRHLYEVVQVVHKLSDVTDKARIPHKGSHFVSVHVKRAESVFFEK